MRRWIHPRCIVTLIAVVLLGLALACGPSAPDGPGQEPPVTAEPTATPTPTPTRNPMATPTYYPDVISRPVPELDPVLNALIIREAAAQSASGGRSVGPDPPGNFTVFVRRHRRNTRVPREQRGNGKLHLHFLPARRHQILPGERRAVGPALYLGRRVNPIPGTTGQPYTWDDGSTLFLADVPASLLPALLQRVEDHRSVAYTGELPYPKLSPELNELVIAYQAGLLPSHDWPTALVTIEYSGRVEAYNRLHQYFDSISDKGGFALMDRHDPTIWLFYGIVPLSHIIPLSALPDVELVTLDVYPDFPGIIDDFLRHTTAPTDRPMPEPKSSSRSSVGVRQSSSTGPTPTPSAGAKAHDVPAWRQAGYKRPDIV